MDGCMLEFGTGSICGAAVACAILLICAALSVRRDRRVKFLAGILLPRDTMFLTRLLRADAQVPDEPDHTQAVLQGLGLIKQVSGHYTLTRFGRRVAEHAQNTDCACGQSQDTGECHET